MNRLQKSALIYLYLMPAIVAALGFGIGHVSYLIYTPLWLINTCIAWFAVRQLTKGTPDLAGIGLMLPWILFSIFAGMGPPPATTANWLATATEQEIRYTIIIIGGISAFMGFALLKAKLQETYSTLGFTLLSVALPLY